MEKLICNAKLILIAFRSNYFSFLRFPFVCLHYLLYTAYLESLHGVRVRNKKKFFDFFGEKGKKKLKEDKTDLK